MNLRAVLPVLLAGALVVALVVLLYVVQSRRFNAADARRRSLAAARGWTYVENTESALFRFEGVSSGRRWRCEAFRPRVGDPSRQGAPHQTVFRVALRGDGIVVLSPTGDGVARAVVLALLRETRGEPAARVAENGERRSLAGPLGTKLEARVTDASRWRASEQPLTSALATIDESVALPMVIWAEDELTVVVGRVVDDDRALATFIDASLALVTDLSARAATAGHDGGA